MANNIIDSIQLSGVTYGIKGSGGTETIELTQAQYDALVDKDPNTFYVITDAQAGDLTNYYTKTETNTLLGGKADTATTYTKTEVDNAITAATSTKQDTLVSSQNIKTINNESILGSGNIDIQGGKAIEAGRGISITTGETADTVSFNFPISANTDNSIVMGGKIVNSFTNNGRDCLMVGSELTANDWSDCCLVVGYRSSVNGDGSAVIGWNSKSVGDSAFAFGTNVTANTAYTFAAGRYSIAKNNDETSFGKYNASNTGSTNADKTLFSVGNGTAENARHNAFEIRQNGDIYLSSGGTDIKLQDHLGGGGSSYTAGDGIDITNDVISVTGKADTSAVTAIQDSLSGYVTTDTEQTISRRKIFTYSASEGKAIEFKQTTNNAKVGFRVVNTASTNNELASFEFRPDSYTDSSRVRHPLLYLGHYRNTYTANAGVVQTMVGFRQYDQKGGAAYNYLIPLPAEAKTPFSLTTSFKNYFAPLGFKNGSTMITTDNTGVADFSDVLGGLKLVKLSQSEYDSLATKDNSTLYVIVN